MASSLSWMSPPNPPVRPYLPVAPLGFHMTPLLITTLVTLSWCVPTTKAIACEPGRRYAHFHNCSAFILCDDNRNPKTFTCPPGLHFNALELYCDWPEKANCTREGEESSKATLENSGPDVKAVGKENVKIIEQKTKVNDEVKNIAFAYKDAEVQTEEPEDKTSTVEPYVSSKSQAKEDQHGGAKKEVKVGNIKIKTNDEGGKEGVTKNKFGDKIKEINDLDTLTSSKPTEDKLEVKSGKSKIEEKSSAQEKGTGNDSGVKKLSLTSKVIHSISKRQDKAEYKKEEIKNTNEKIKEDEKSMKNMDMLIESSEIEMEKSDTTEEKNTTSDEEFSYKELNFSNQSLIYLAMETNTTEYNQDNEGSEPTINNGSDEEYVPVNLNPMQNIFGYDIFSSDTGSSTSESSPTNESAPTGENVPTSDSSPTSGGKSRTESVSTSNSAPTNTSEPTVAKQHKRDIAACPTCG